MHATDHAIINATHYFDYRPKILSGPNRTIILHVQSPVEVGSLRYQGALLIGTSELGLFNVGLDAASVFKNVMSNGERVFPASCTRVIERPSNWPTTVTLPQIVLANGLEQMAVMASTAVPWATRVLSAMYYSFPYIREHCDESIATRTICPHGWCL